KNLRLDQRGQSAMHLQLAVAVSLLQARQELATEQAAQHLHRQEVTLTSRDPAAAVVRETAPRHHAVQMGVETQLRGPGVQDGRETDLGSRRGVSQSPSCATGPLTEGAGTLNEVLVYNRCRCYPQSHERSHAHSVRN